MEGDKRHVTGEKWKMTRDKCHVIGNRCQVWMPHHLYGQLWMFRPGKGGGRGGSSLAPEGGGWVEAEDGSGGRRRGRGSLSHLVTKFGCPGLAPILEDPGHNFKPNTSTPSQVFYPVCSLMCFTLAKNKKFIKPTPLRWIQAYIMLESSRWGG